MLSSQTVADYLAAGHTVPQAAKRFHITERTIYRIKARVATPAPQAECPTVAPARPYVPRPADEVILAGSYRLAMDGELQRVRQTITGAQWNDLQVRGVALPALCPVPESAPAADVSAVTDNEPTFEPLQSSKIDDTTPDMAAVTDSMAVPIVMLPAVASASSGMDGFVKTSNPHACNTGVSSWVLPVVGWLALYWRFALGVVLGVVVIWLCR
jgi:transposase-like protein